MKQCPWGCGPLVHDTRRETICILGHTIERVATGWWCDKCGEVVLEGADLAASEADVQRAKDREDKRDCPWGYGPLVIAGEDDVRQAITEEERELAGALLEAASSAIGLPVRVISGESTGRKEQTIAGMVMLIRQTRKEKSK